MSHEVNYLARDYTAIRQEMLSRAARRIPEWKTAGSTDDFGVMLIEAFSYTADMMSYYIDRVLNEGLIEFAVLPESVRNLAALVGYVPNQMVPGTGFVTITLKPGSDQITIPAEAELVSQSAVGAAPIYFTTDEEIVLGGGEPEAGVVPVTQGRLIHDESAGFADGTAEQSYRLFHPSVVLADMSVRIKGVPWTQRTSFAESGPNSRHYIVRVDQENLATIVFGDGAAGALPPTNAEILVSYRYANGAAGNVGVGAIDMIVESYPEIASISNELPITGGQWQDTVNDIKREVRLGFTAIDRAVTTEDFAAIAIDVPGVLFASAVADNYAHVLVYVVPTAGGPPDPLLLEEVESYLEERALVGTDVTGLAPAYVPVNVQTTIYIDDSFVQEDVYNAVVDAVADTYALGTHPLGQDAYVAEMWQTVLDVDGVLYMDLDLFARDDVAQTGAVNQPMDVNEVVTLGLLTVIPEGGIQ